MYLREDGTPYYIGKGKHRRAWSTHRSVKIPSNKERIVIHTDDLTERQAFSLEVELISKYGRKDNGTGILRNLTDGGEGSSGYVFTNSHRKNLSDAWKDRPAATSETRSKMSLSRKGKTLTEETKQRMSNSARGRDVSHLHKKAACPHCGKETNAGMLARWHFDNCKALR